MAPSPIPLRTFLDMVPQLSDHQDLFSFDVHEVPAYLQCISPTSSCDRAPSPPPVSQLLPPRHSQEISPALNDKGALPAPNPSQSISAASNGKPATPLSQDISAVSNAKGACSPAPLSPSISAFGHDGPLSPLPPPQQKHGGDDDHVILFTVLGKSGKPATWIQQGAAYLSYVKETIPSFFANRSLLFNNFSLAVRQRLFEAISPSFHVELPSLEFISIVSAAILASTVIETVKGTGLVSTFSWNVPGETHILDVIRTKALQRYIDEEAIAEAKAAREAAYAELREMRAAAYTFHPIDEYDRLPNLSVYDDISENFAGTHEYDHGLRVAADGSKSRSPRFS
ncbi:hypothetical protein BD410DRAFT_810139 [Rickenella mellea]|uniref:Uncharacterized protein n=1 Tax=Rickenella mellea TaxID=50990 RepID=A0A4Y7PEZ2_9AGAM|nr:hypothetical protein BD410DRAFT_810139 [Rickenella mellea]